MSETGDPYFDAMGALADHNLDELIKAREALAASAARIEAMNEMLDAHIKGEEALRDAAKEAGDARDASFHSYGAAAIRALKVDIARAALDAAPRSEDRKSDEFWSFTNRIGR